MGTTKKNLDIGELAKLSEMKPSKIRYYEEVGLIKSTGRNGLRRVFGHSVLERISFIKLAQFSGFSLKEIKKYFMNDRRVKVDREALVMKADEIEQTIKKLKMIQKGLIHASKCPEKNHFDCPKFRRLLKLKP
jgi:DNA-binding transcriptional MerR regulator